MTLYFVDSFCPELLHSAGALVLNASGLANNDEKEQYNDDDIDNNVYTISQQRQHNDERGLSPSQSPNLACYQRSPMNLTKSRLTRDRSSRRRHAIQPSNNPINSPITGKSSSSGKKLGRKGRKVSKTVNDMICEESTFYPMNGDRNSDSNENRAIENSEYNDLEDGNMITNCDNENNDTYEINRLEGGNCAVGNDNINNNCNNDDNDISAESPSMHFERCNYLDNDNSSDNEIGTQNETNGRRRTVNFDDDSDKDKNDAGSFNAFSDNNDNNNNSGYTGSHPYPARYYQRNSLPIITSKNNNNNINEDGTTDHVSNERLCNGSSKNHRSPPSHQQMQKQKHQYNYNNDTTNNTPVHHRHQHRYQNQCSMPDTRSSSFTQQDNIQGAGKSSNNMHKAAFRTRSISEHRPPPPNNFRSPVSARRRNVIHCDELLQYQPKRLTAVEQKLRRKMTFVPSFHTASSVSEAAEMDVSASQTSLFGRTDNQGGEMGQRNQQPGATSATSSATASTSGSTTTAAGTPRPPWMIKAALSRSISPISESAIILS